MRAAILLVCVSGLAAGVWCGPATGQVSGGPTGQSAGQDASGLPTGGGLIGSVMFEGVYASGDTRLSVTSTGGSSMAGSGSGQWSIVDGGLQVSHAGYWAAMATQNGNYIVLVDQPRQQHQIRYTFHNGQSVLGESGSRSFWSRAR